VSRTTFQNALAEMHALLGNVTTFAPVASLATAGAKVVFPFEPGAAGWVKPCSVTMSPAGMDATDWQVLVRVYVDAGQAPAVAQDLLIDVTVAVGARLASGSGYGPDEWRFDYIDALDCWVASSTVLIGREDF
jgi:hypothetical protein